MFKTIFAVGFLSFAAVINAAAQDSDRIDRLEKEVQETKARLSKLEALLANPSNSQNPVTSGEAQTNMIDGYKQRIHDKIMRLVVLPPNIQGNPEAAFDVVMQPDGNPLGVKLKSSSGNKAYDNAVERAILKAAPLPLPPDAALFKYLRELTLRFKAQE